MPIGVPKVPTHARGTVYPVDIYNRLYRERIIFLGKDVDDEIANQIIAVMLYLIRKIQVRTFICTSILPVVQSVAWRFMTPCSTSNQMVTICVGLAASRGHSPGSWNQGKRWRCPTGL